MAISLKTSLKYLISLGLAVVLLLLIFKNIDFASMVDELKKVNYFWVLVSMLVSITSHVSRAIRWNQLLEPMGKKPSTLTATSAIMVGYMANYAIPRIGEITRCSILQKTDGIPVNSSLGTVVTERLLDVFMLFLLIGLSLLLEFTRLGNLIFSVFRDKLAGPLQFLTSHWTLLFIPALVVLCGLWLVYRFKSFLLKLPFTGKMLEFLLGLWKGFISIFQLKSPWLFTFHTLNIWLFYCIMTYFVLLSVEGANNLPIQAALIATVMGGLGMAAPVQGGVGAYHFMVSSGLMLYGISYEKGVLLATIMHASQMLLNIFLGIVGFIITSYQLKNEK